VVKFLNFLPNLIVLALFYILQDLFGDFVVVKTLFSLYYLTRVGAVEQSISCIVNNLLGLLGILSNYIAELQADCLQLVIFNEQLVRANTPLSGGPSFNLFGLRLFLRDECLNNVDSSCVLDIFFSHDKVDASTKGSGHDGNVLCSSCSNNTSLCGVCVVSLSQGNRVSFECFELVTHIKLVNHVDCSKEDEHWTVFSNLHRNGLTDFLEMFFFFDNSRPHQGPSTWSVDRRDFVELRNAVPVF